nr:unnamed protein product [Digitaria exilis]
MEFAIGAIGTLLPKLLELLKEEYDLQKSVKKGIQFLVNELESMQAALNKVSEVPAEQVEEDVKIWTRAVREMSYEIEDKVDGFLVRASKGENQQASAKSIKGFVRTCRNSLAKVKLRHKMAADVMDIKCRVMEAKKRRDRYNFDNIVRGNTNVTTIDPRIGALFKKSTELVGIEKAVDKLIDMLSVDAEDGDPKLVSVVGVGGLGKTTLAKAVFDKLKVRFQGTAFVSSGDPKGGLGDKLKHLGDLLQLRYLRLVGWSTGPLPEEIGNLKCLQIVDCERWGCDSFSHLPSSIGHLTQLLCLRFCSFVPDGIIRKLTSLQDLMIELAYNTNTNLLAELGNLRDLRMLNVHLGELDQRLVEAFLVSLQNMHKLRHLSITAWRSSSLRWEAPGFVVPRQLRSLKLMKEVSLTRLPTWINSSLLPNLSFLSVQVWSMDYRDMRVLGRLPELCCLHLYTRRDMSGAPVMPSLEDIRFYVHPEELLKFHVHLGSQTVIGLDNIPLVEKIGITINEWDEVIARINCEDATLCEVEAAEESLRRAVKVEDVATEVAAKLKPDEEEPDALSSMEKRNANYAPQAADRNSMRK